MPPVKKDTIAAEGGMRVMMRAAFSNMTVEKAVGKAMAEKQQPVHVEHEPA